MPDSHIELEAALLCTSLSLDRSSPNSVAELRGLTSVGRVDQLSRKPVGPLWLFVSLARVSRQAMIEVSIKHLTIISEDTRSQFLQIVKPGPDIRKPAHVALSLSQCELRELGEYRVEVLIDRVLMGTARLYAEVVAP